jgi:hypothetical protein
MANSFDDLTTEKFRKRMRPHALRIYAFLYPNSKTEDLREDGVKVHVLDKEYGIDTKTTLPSGMSFTIQEKYRDNDFLCDPRKQISPPVPDFTQEYMNAAGTPTESQGEWFHLAAQMYFYGWANGNLSDFAAWVLFDITRYKMLVEAAGGLERVGTLKQNCRHGKASFYAIPITSLRPAWIYWSDGTRVFTNPPDARFHPGPVPSPPIEHVHKWRKIKTFDGYIAFSCSGPKSLDCYGQEDLPCGKVATENEHLIPNP